MSDPIPREHHIKSEDHYLVYIPKSRKACIREREREGERDLYHKIFIAEKSKGDCNWKMMYNQREWLAHLQYISYYR
jgi:hypothetical protein